MSSEQEAREAAEEFREKLGLGLAPIDDLDLLFDSFNVDVITVLAGEDEHGLTARDEATGTTVVVVSSSLPSVRFRSTLAHEMCHLIFDDDLDFSTSHTPRSSKETRANAFARHLLLPLGAVSLMKNQNPDLSTADLHNLLVQRYGVSPKIAAYQMKKCGVIDKNTERELEACTTRDLATHFGWESLMESRNQAVRKIGEPRRLHRAAAAAYAAGTLSALEFTSITAAPPPKGARAQHESSTQPSEPAPLDLTNDDLSDLL